MHRAALSLILLLGLLLAGAPPAAACSLPVPQDFSRLQWLDEETLLTNQGDRLGRYDVATGSFEPLLGTLHYAVSPDGRWLAFGHGDERPPQRNAINTCDSGRLGALEVVDLQTGARAKVADGAPRLLVAGTEYLVYRTVLKEHLQVVRWDDLDGARDLVLAVPETQPRHAVRLDALRSLALTPGDRYLVAEVVEEDRPLEVYVFALATGRPVDAAEPAVELDDSGRFQRGVVAIAPSGDALALGRGAESRFGEVNLVRLHANGTETYALHASLERPMALAWGRSALAAGYIRHVSWYEEGETQHVLRVFRGPGNLSDVVERTMGNRSGIAALAWSPDGTRLAVGTWSGLLLLDQDLRGEGAPPIVNNGTARFPVTVQDGGASTPPQSVPGLAAGAVLGALAAVALALRRTRRGAG